MGGRSRGSLAGSAAGGLPTPQPAQPRPCVTPYGERSAHHIHPWSWPLSWAVHRPGRPCTGGCTQSTRRCHTPPARSLHPREPQPGGCGGTRGLRPGSGPHSPPQEAPAPGRPLLQLPPPLRSAAQRLHQRRRQPAKPIRGRQPQPPPPPSPAPSRSRSPPPAARRQHGPALLGFPSSVLPGQALYEAGEIRGRAAPARGAPPKSSGAAPLRRPPPAATARPCPPAARSSRGAGGEVPLGGA